MISEMVKKFDHLPYSVDVITGIPTRNLPVMLNANTDYRTAIDLNHAESHAHGRFLEGIKNGIKKGKDGLRRSLSNLSLKKSAPRTQTNSKYMKNEDMHHPWEKFKRIFSSQGKGE